MEPLVDKYKFHKMDVKIGGNMFQLKWKLVPSPNGKPKIMDVMIKKWTRIECLDSHTVKRIHAKIYEHLSKAPTEESL